MNKRRVKYIVGVALMLIGVIMGSQRVSAAGTYKVVYHYKMGETERTVTKQIRCGSRYTLLSGTKVGFTESGKYLAAWSGRKQTSNTWAMKRSGSSSSYYWGKYNKNQLYYFRAGDRLPGNYKSGERIHLYGYWVDLDNIDVTEPPFGANGKDAKADDVAIQRALNIADYTKKTVKVYVPSGNYYLSKGLKVYSNTTLKFADNTLIRRLKKFRSGCMVQVGNAVNVKSKVGGYNQAQNITIDGGRWIGDPSGTYSDAPIMRFHHCKNIVLQNGIVEQYSGKHGVTFVAAKNVLINAMTFRKQKLTKGSEFYKLIKRKPISAKNGEAIHTDFAGKADHALPYDGTICDKVRITHCVFSNIYTGLGSHINTSKKGTSYIVCNNAFKNVKYNCMNLYSRDKVEIYSNRMINCGAFLGDKKSTYLRLEYPVNAKGTVSSILKEE